MFQFAPKPNCEPNCEMFLAVYYILHLQHMSLCEERAGETWRTKSGKHFQMSRAQADPAAHLLMPWWRRSAAARQGRTRRQVGCALPKASTQPRITPSPRLLPGFHHRFQHNISRLRQHNTCHCAPNFRGPRRRTVAEQRFSSCNLKSMVLKLVSTCSNIVSNIVSS